MVTAVVYICARSSLKTATTTPSAMNPFRKRHTDDKMCQIALVVVVAVAAAHFGVFNLFVCVFVCLFFLRSLIHRWSSSSIVCPRKKKYNRLYCCQSFGRNGFFSSSFGWQNVRAWIFLNEFIDLFWATDLNLWKINILFACIYLRRSEIVTKA